MKILNILIVAILGAALINSCDETPVVPTQEELISTVNLTLTPAGIGPTVNMSFRDLDGTGGNAPEITGGMLMPFTDYNCEIAFLNETVSPTEDITEEVEEEKEEHQVFFEVSGLDLTITYGDMDANGNPVGLVSTWTTGDVGIGSFVLTLRHEPEKEAAGVSDGDISNAGGSTDIEISLPVEIQ